MMFDISNGVLTSLHAGAAVFMESSIFKLEILASVANQRNNGCDFDKDILT